MKQEFISQKTLSLIAKRINDWRLANLHLTDDEAIEKLGKLFENSETVLEYMEATKIAVFHNIQPVVASGVALIFTTSLYSLKQPMSV